MTPEQIAAKLTKAQRAALLFYLPAAYRLTPLGVAVRQVVAREVGDG